MHPEICREAMICLLWDWKSLMYRRMFEKQNDEQLYVYNPVA